MALERDSGSGIRDISTSGDDPCKVAAVELLPMLVEDDDDDDQDTASAGEEDCVRAATETPAADKVHHHQHHLQHRQQPRHAPAAAYMQTVEDLFRLSAEQQQQQQQVTAAAMPTAETLRLFLQHCANNKLLQQTRPEHYRGGDAPTDCRSPSPPRSAATTAATSRLPPPMATDLWPAAAAAAAAVAALDPQHMGTYLSRLLSTSAATTSPSTGLGSPHLPAHDSPPSPLPPPPPLHPQDFLKGFTVTEIMRKILDDEQHQYSKSIDPRRWSSNGFCLSEPMDTGRSNDDDSNPSNVILRVPSYKPVPGKGGEYESTTVGGRELRSPARANSIRSDTSSPPSSSGGGGAKHPVNFRDVMAKSITHKFQTASEPQLPPPIPAVESLARAYHQYQQQHQQHHQQGMPVTAVYGPGSTITRNHNNNNLLDDCRKRVPTPTKTSSALVPSSGSGLHASGSSSSSSSNSVAAAAAAALISGKGTRPKRGKYRNYDRDSLIEAVRAVQRGEMSVHRAGSYYGVPHSTLEYKVKERHLMRPRKREPKNPPSTSSVSAVNPDQDRKKSSTELSMPPRSVDNKSSSATPPAVKLPAHVFPSQQPPSLQAPNVLKMFETTGGQVGSYQPSFPFWAPSSFHMSMDFQRNPVAFTSMSMMQRMQAETRLHHHQTATATIASLGKNAREVAENLYDGTDNGSFLDGIIRSSLDTGLKSATAIATAQAFAKIGGAVGECSPERMDDRHSPMEEVEDNNSQPENRATTPPSCKDSGSESEDEVKHQPDLQPESPTGQESPDDSAEQHTTTTVQASSSSPDHATETENDDQ